MTTALIADDEPHLAAHLQQLLTTAWTDLAVVAVARNGVDAAAQIEALRPDLAFLDIKMPGLTGLQVAQGIEGATKVVFVTAYDAYAVDAFEQQALDYLLKPVTAWPDLAVVSVARNGVDAAAQIEALRPDLAFLDIKMPGLTGLAVAQGIEGATKVVFVTAYDAYAVDAFEQQALDYLLKPVTADRLAKTVARVRTALAATGPSADDARLAAVLRQLLPARAPVPRLRYVRAARGDSSHQVAVDDVLFFRADDKYTCVHTAGAEHLIRTPIAELVAQLDPDVFWQVHRSTVVNLAHVAGTRRDELSRLYIRVRGHAAELPVSRAYVHLFKAM